MAERTVGPLILVVEDYPEARQMYSEYLRFTGFRVVEARNGMEALEKAVAHLPDAVLMDLALPIMDGWEATRRLKSDPRTMKIPVIALTGHALAGHREGAMRAGCDAFMTKPCLPDEMVDEIRRVLSGRAPGSSPPIENLDRDGRRAPSRQTSILTAPHLVSAQPRRVRVFVCHATPDKLQARELYARLKSDAFDPWLDEENLLPGQDWEKEIAMAVRTADVVAVCLSAASITKRGYVQREIKLALDAAEERPEGQIFIVPVRLEECEVPERLRRWHWVNLYDPAGYAKFTAALRVAAFVS